MSDIERIVARVEAAEGPDRELDAAIAVALKIGCRVNLSDDLEHLSLPNKHEPGPGVTAGHYWFHCRSGMSLRSAPSYSASLDAAMSLVPDDAFWRVGHDGDGADPSEFFAHILVPKLGGRDLQGRGLAATPALALVAACLRAHLERQAHD